MAVAYADDAKAHYGPTGRVIETAANTGPDEMPKFIAEPASSKGTRDAFMLKHFASYAVKDAVRKTVDRSMGLHEGKTAMQSRCIAHYNTTSTKVADTFAPALAAVDTRAILDIQYAIAPFAKAQWDKHAKPLTISA